MQEPFRSQKHNCNLPVTITILPPYAGELTCNARGKKFFLNALSPYLELKMEPNVS